MAPADPPQRRAERVEVARSRDQILDAAERWYSERSGDPTMSELALLAGVGNATLYRRFPSIDDVVRALYWRLMAHLQEVADVAFVMESGWDAVVIVMSGIASTIAEHPAIPKMTRRMLELEPDLQHGSQWDGGLKEIARRAQAEGKLRKDVDSNDINFAAFRIGDYVYLPVDARPRMIARQLAIAIDGFRADGTKSAMPGEGITTEEIQGYWREPMR